MPSEFSSSKRVDISIDPAKVAEISKVGIRRASAFLRIGQEISTLEIPDDISLDVGTKYQFWPFPLEPDAKKNIREAFDSWVVGSCFKELEAHFALFLDEIWKLLDLSDYHGRTVPAGGQINFDSKFSRDTNIANKAKRIFDRITVQDDASELNSISRARNALTHGAGRVRTEDAKDGGKLDICWKSIDIVLVSNGEETLVNTEPFQPFIVTDDNGARVFLRTVKRTKSFAIGQRIELSRRDLAEICFFFNFQTDTLIQQLSAHLSEKFKDQGLPASTGDS